MGKQCKKRIRRLIPLFFGAVAVALIGTTIAVHNDWTIFNNALTTEPFPGGATEEFVSPTEWKTCEETDKTAVYDNKSNLTVSVRMKYVDYWRNKTNTAMLNPTFLDDNNQIQSYAIINFQNENDWELRSDGWYYYKTAVAPHTSTSSLFKSVTFNCDANFSGGDNVCHDTPTGQVCDMTTNAYEESSYHVEITFQAKSEWDPDCETREEDPSVCWPPDHTQYYTVTVNPNGGKYNGSEDTWTDQVKYGTPVDLSNIAWDAHHTFRGWTVNDTQNYTEQSYTVTGDTTIIANWVYDGDGSYIVTVDPNGGEYNGTTAITTYNVNNNDIYNILADVRDGYEVAYWLRDNTTKVRDNYIVVNGDTTIKAIWANARNERTHKIYADVAEAMEEARDGDRITVLHDHESTFTNTKKNITLDLGGYTVTGQMTNAQNASITLLNGEINNPNGTGVLNYGTLIMGIDDYDYSQANWPATIDNNNVRIIGTTIGLDQRGTFDFFDGYIEGEVALAGPYRNTPFYHDAFDDRDVYFFPLISHNPIRDCQHAQLDSADNAITKTTVGGTIYYYNLQDNLKTSEVTGYTIYAIRDFDATYALNIDRYKPGTQDATEPVNFDLSGFDVVFAETATNAGTFNIYDSTEHNTLTTQQSIENTSTGTLSITSIDITSANDNPIINNDGTATITDSTYTGSLINSGTITYTNSTLNGSTLNDDGNITLTNSTMDDVVVSGINSITMNSTSRIDGDITKNNPTKTSITGGTLNGSISITEELNMANVQMNGHITSTGQGIINLSGTSTVTSDIDTAINMNHGSITMSDTSALIVANSTSDTVTYGIRCTGTPCTVTMNDQSRIELTSSQKKNSFGINAGYKLDLAMNDHSQITVSNTNTTTGSSYSTYGAYCHANSSTDYDCNLTMTGNSYIKSSANLNTIYGYACNGICVITNSGQSSIEAENTPNNGTSYGIYTNTYYSSAPKKASVTLSDFASVTSSGQTATGIFTKNILDISDNASIESTSTTGTSTAISAEQYYSDITANGSTCSITSISDSGYSYGIKTNYSTDINMTDCTIEAYSNSGNAYGLYSNYSSYNRDYVFTSSTINANTKTGSYATGIYGSYSTSRITLTDSSVSGTIDTPPSTHTARGIYGGNTITINYSTVNGTDSGIYPTGGTSSVSAKLNITGSTITGGISGVGEEANYTKATVTDSTITGGTTGYIQAANSNNTYTGSAITGGTNGIVMQSNAVNTITDSTITGTSSYGISSLATSQPTVKGNSVVRGGVNGINIAANGIATIGVADYDVSITNPEIIGDSYAIYGGSTGSVHFYDGVLKGGINSTPSGLITAVEDSTSTHSERIDGIENTWLVISADYLEVNGTTYNSLTDAYEAVADGGTINVIRNYTTNATLPTNPSGKTITIDLKGFTLNYVNTLTNNGTINIQDSVGGGILSNTAADAPTITNSGTININSGTVRGGDNNVAIQNSADGNVVNLNGGKVTGGKIGISKGTITLNGGHIEIDSAGTTAYGIADSYKVYVKNYSHINVNSTNTGAAESAAITGNKDLFSITEHGTINVSAKNGTAYGISEYQYAYGYTATVAGDASITVTNENGSAKGINTYVYYSDVTSTLNVSGNATIDVTAGTTANGIIGERVNITGYAAITSESTDGSATGIRAYSYTTMSSNATINVEAAGAARGVDYGTLTISGSTSITAHSTNGSSYGFTDNGLAMSGGSIVAHSDDPTATSTGAYLSGESTITGGSIYGDTYGIEVYTYSSSTRKLTLGENNGTISTTSPVIHGGQYGISGGYLYFYDGVAKGGTNARINTTEVKALPDGTSIHTERRGDTEDCWIAAATEYLEVNGVRYSALGDAYDAVSSGGTIYVVSDYATEAVLPASPSGKTITFDLQGHSLSYKHVMKFNNDFTITNSSTTAVGSISSTNGDEYTINSNANTTINNVRISNPKNTISNISGNLQITDSIIEAGTNGIASSAGQITVDGDSEINVNGCGSGITQTSSQATILSDDASITITCSSSGTLYGISSPSAELSDNSSITINTDGNGKVYGIYGTTSLTMDDYSSIAITSPSGSSETNSIYGVYGMTTTASGHASISISSSYQAATGILSTSSNRHITLSDYVTISVLGQGPYTNGIKAKGDISLTGNVKISATGGASTSYDGNDDVIGVQADSAKSVTIQNNVEISAEISSAARYDTTAYGIYLYGVPSSSISLSDSFTVSAKNTPISQYSYSTRNDNSIAIYSNRYISQINGSAATLSSIVTSKKGVRRTYAYGIKIDLNANATNEVHVIGTSITASAPDYSYGIRSGNTSYQDAGYVLENVTINSTSPTGQAYGYYCDSYCSDINVIGGKIEGKTYGIYLPDQNVVLGQDDGTAVMTPEIKSPNYPINSNRIIFYDGKLVGGIDAYYTRPDRISVIADNYTIYLGTQSIDGTSYKVSYLIPSVDVAQIGATKYQKLSDAISAAGTNDTIQLLNTNYIFESITIPSNKEFTIDVNGKDIVSSYPIINEGNVTVTNTSATKPTHSYGYTDSYYITNETGATLAFNNIKLEAEKVINNKGTLTLTGSYINETKTWSSTTSYSAIDNTGTLTTNSTTIRSGGTGIDNAGTANINNDSNIDGKRYALYTYNGATANIDRSTISYIYGNGSNNAITIANSSNIAQSYLPASTTTNVTNSAIKNVTNAGTLVADNITVAAGSSTGISTSGDATIINSTFTGNSPFSNTGTASLTNNTISSAFNSSNMTSTQNTYGSITNGGTLTSTDDTANQFTASGASSSSVATLNNITVNGPMVNSGAGEIKFVTGTLNVSGSEVIGVSNTGSGTITLGEPEPTTSPNYGTEFADVSTSNPSITAIGTTSGIGASNTGTGRINFYDGIITGNTQAMDIVPNNTEYMYEVHDGTDQQGYHYRILVFARPTTP